MAYVRKYSVRLPPGCGNLRNESLLYNPYLHDPEKGFMAARRKRFCLNCQTVGSMTANCEFICPNCGTQHTSNLTAPRLYDRLLLLAGRGGGKTLGGAHAVLEEIQVPNATWWIMGPNHKWLHDSTKPTLLGLIDPAWVDHWDGEHEELKLKNQTLLAFRSLEDPERARGPHGVNGGWFDEAAQCPERAFDVFIPTLAEAGGIVLATTTVLGFDWTYDRIEKEAMRKEPGYWFAKFWTEENPLYKKNPVMMRDLERAKRTMHPDFYAQEYRAERRIGTTLIYPYKLIEEQTLETDEAVKKIIPEWPDLDSTREILIGLDSGADHPFGAAMAVVTDKGVVFMGEYLERMQAISQHLAPISQRFGVSRFTPEKITWAANKNEANLRLEWGLKGIGVQAAESKHEVGTQRVNSWLFAKQLWFVKSRCPRLIDQMQTHRYANNVTPDGQKKKEQVFKQKDELPDCVRYALMAFPELPSADQPIMTDSQQRRWNALSDRTKLDLERVREFDKKDRQQHLNEGDPGYPLGDFFNIFDEHTGPETW